MIEKVFLILPNLFFFLVSASVLMIPEAGSIMLPGCPSICPVLVNVISWTPLREFLQLWHKCSLGWHSRINWLLYSYCSFLQRLFLWTRPKIALLLSPFLVSSTLQGKRFFSELKASQCSPASFCLLLGAEQVAFSVFFFFRSLSLKTAACSGR